MTAPPRIKAALAALGLTFAVCSCSSSAVPRKSDEQIPPEVPAGGSLVRGAGATFPSILYRQWFSRYGETHPGRVVSYAAVGSGEGVRRFIGRGLEEDENVDFGASDAAMTDDEQARTDGGAVLVPVTAGQVVMAYNLPDLRTDLRLSRETYAGIFLGTITNWSDPRIARDNPGVKLPRLTIVTIVRQDGSGTTFAFTKHLDAISEAWHARYGAATLVNWPGSAMRASGNEGVAARITQSVGSLGYVGFEFARRVGLQTALVQNRAGRFVAPSEQNGASAVGEADLPENMRAYVPDPAGPGSYPIVTLSWILLRQTYRDPRMAGELRDLFRWCLTDGQSYAAALGYIPLPSNIVDRSLAQLEKVHGAGSTTDRVSSDTH
jgi:phosphate transport system substrate-binding protein